MRDGFQLVGDFGEPKERDSFSRQGDLIKDSSTEVEYLSSMCDVLFWIYNTGKKQNQGPRKNHNANQRIDVSNLE